MKTRNCIVYITHRMDVCVLNYLKFINQAVGNIMDLIVLYDCATQAVNAEDFPYLHFHIFDSRVLENFFHHHNRLLSNPLVALLECAKCNKYEHYLLMENDIILNGSMSSFVKKINREEADYIHIATDILGSPDAHWPIKYIRDNPFDDLRFAWCQLFYISYRYLLDLSDFVKINNSLYYEFLLPTMAYASDYVVKQFEGMGYRFQLSWGPANVFEFKYVYERTPNTFYHPIKNLGIVDLKCMY